MNVAISVKDGYADVWADNYVKRQPQARKNINMPARPTVSQVVATIQQAVNAAGRDGVVLFNIGHGAVAEGSSPLEGWLDLAPNGVVNLGGYHSKYGTGKAAKPTFTDVFYDTNVAGAPAFSDQANDQKFNAGSAGTKTRQGHWLTYQQIAASFKSVRPRKVVFLTCRVGNSDLFLKKIANDWGVIVEAYKDKMQLTPQGKRVRMHLKGDPAGQGTNIPENEEEVPLATEPNSVRVGPPR